MDPDVIPLGSTVIIEVDGYKDEYVARDVGGNIRGHRIDIYKHVSLDELNRLGRKEVKVWLK